MLVAKGGAGLLEEAWLPKVIAVENRDDSAGSRIDSRVARGTDSCVFLVNDSKRNAGTDCTHGAIGLTQLINHRLRDEIVGTVVHYGDASGSKTLFTSGRNRMCKSLSLVKAGDDNADIARGAHTSILGSSLCANQPCGSGST